ncbi:hypothetical protein NDU88_003289 [Pleurodeles waltl]|uniref:Uncharacterized protein n=1 Tax=Pleurodeles waltl TaxID=8319 RepID=A0AAV7NHS7_PLEWA|nr:hypothetical protein NDU88_003289 [Pleurodeles waltl]
MPATLVQACFKRSHYRSGGASYLAAAQYCNLGELVQPRRTEVEIAQGFPGFSPTGWESFKAAFQGQRIAYKSAQRQIRTTHVKELQDALDQAHKALMKEVDRCRNDHKLKFDQARQRLRNFYVCKGIASSKNFLQQQYEELVGG